MKKTTREVTCSQCGARKDVIDGSELRELRISTGLSLRAMARHLKLSAPYLSDLERNQRTPTEKIVKAYRAAVKGA